MEITRYKCKLIQEDDTIVDFFRKVVPWTIVHGGQKLELAQKFMQVAIDVKCIETNFGGHGFFGFGDFAPSCLPSKQPNSPFGHSWGSKIDS